MSEIILSKREYEVLQYITRENAEIAFKLGISINTVIAHFASIYKKFGVHSRVEAVIFAIKHDIMNVYQFIV